ncbi:MAG: hypothetical protein PHG48_01600 [Eubacteriales bacterium]|jgi:glutamate synthase domain-containing protein 3|nr:hypothetical protein [Eubacteriales bacterium]
MFELNAAGLHFTELNRKVRELLKDGAEEIILKNVGGQRYIADGITGSQKIYIEGVPGNDMAAYMDGPEVTVFGNVQDSAANTMNSGRIIIHGSAGDTAGYAMRGGEIFIRDDAGYRTGIHMKEYKDKKPVIVIGGKAGDFLGEYMAGGIIVLLGISSGHEGDIVGSYCGTGMHNGVIYIRGGAEAYRFGKEVKTEDAVPGDLEIISGYVARYTEYFGGNAAGIMSHKFQKITSFSSRPYGKIYAH